MMRRKRNVSTDQRIIAKAIFSGSVESGPSFRVLLINDELSPWQQTI